MSTRRRFLHPIWLLVSLLVGSLPGIVIGSLLSTRVPEKVLRNAYPNGVLDHCGLASIANSRELLVRDPLQKFKILDAPAASRVFARRPTAPALAEHAAT